MMYLGSKCAKSSMRCVLLKWLIQVSSLPKNITSEIAERSKAPVQKAEMVAGSNPGEGGRFGESRN